MSGALGFIVLLPLAAAGAAAAVAAVAAATVTIGAAGLVGYGLVKGIEKLMEPERSRPARTDNTKRIEIVRQEVQSQINKELEAITVRHQASENMAQNLKSTIKDTETRIQNALRLQQEASVRALQGQRGEYLRLLQEQEKNVTESLQREKSERQSAFDALQSKIDTIKDDASRREEISRAILKDVEEVVRNIDQMPHLRFAPGKMKKISRQLFEARQSLAAGMPDAALSRIQSAYHDAVELRRLVIEKEQEFLLIKGALLQETGEILEEIKTNSILILDLSEGEEKNEFELDVDYWGRGELKVIENEIQSVRQRLTEQEASITPETMRTLLEDATRMRTKIPEVVIHSKENLVASQARVNIAELAANTLSEQGFDPIDAAYAGEDERNAYTVKLRNIAGGEVVAVIAPVDGEPGKNSILINNYDETFVDEATMQQRALEIVEALQQEGVQVSQPKCLGNAKPEYRDLDRVRQREKSVEAKVRSKLS